LELFGNKEIIMNRRSPDFVATLIYRTTEEGGRRTPAKSGYRPQVKFDFVEMQTSGQQVFMDKEWVYPGLVIGLSYNYADNQSEEQS
jgi:translation elongation factor EF-Tu-like GTPase